jgi:hypothetical protein
MERTTTIQKKDYFLVPVDLQSWQQLGGNAASKARQMRGSQLLTYVYPNVATPIVNPLRDPAGDFAIICQSFDLRQGPCGLASSYDTTPE